VVKPALCIGCRSCELICSFRRTSEFGDCASAVSVLEPEGSTGAFPMMCMHCDEPECTNVCPTEAIVKNEKTHEVHLDLEKCISCRMCIRACPMGNIHFNRKFRKIIKCDLCEGNPMCVNICPVGAIDYVDTTDEVAYRPLNLIE
jgi:Fe-S-cluster-containing dehydrogenase component